MEDRKEEEAKQPASAFPVLSNNNNNNVPEDPFTRRDASAQDTLRTRNNSRSKSIGNINDLFAPPSLQQQQQQPQQQQDPPANRNYFDGMNGSTPSASPPPPLFSSEALPPMRPDTEMANDNVIPTAAAPPPHRRLPSTIRFAPQEEEPSHRRDTSWGVDSQLSERNFFQPNLLGGNPGSSIPKPQSIRQRGTSVGISLEDLQQARPMENEAEAYLIKILEKRDQEQSRRFLVEGGAPGPAAAVLSNVSREDLEAVRPIEPVADESLPSRTGTNKDSQRSGVGGAVKKPTSVADATARSAQVRRRAARGHRRDETIGDRLEFLAAAMDDIHLQHLNLVDDDDDTLPDALQNKPLNMSGANASSADALQQNANLLFNQNRVQTDKVPKDTDMQDDNSLHLSPNQSEISSVGTATSSKSKWKLVRNTMHMTKMPNSASPKKEERLPAVEGGIEEADEEMGSSEDNQPPVVEPDVDPSPKDSSLTKAEKLTPYKVRTQKNKFVTELEEFFAPRRKTIFHFLHVTIFFIVVPSLAISAALFYLAGNTPTGRIDIDASKNLPEDFDGEYISTEGKPIGSSTSSASWWLLFLGVRQMITFIMAKAVELFFIDFLSVRSRFSVRFVGPWVTLFILQTKGWPFLVFMWGIFNFALLSGTRPFFAHWAYWQKHVDWLNEANPSGEVVDSIWHHRVVAIAVSLGIVVSAKRFWLGLYLGRQTFVQYSDKLADVMKKILLVSEVSSLGRAFEREEIRDAEQGNTRRSVAITAESYGLNKERFEGLMGNESDDNSTTGNYTQSDAAGEMKSTRVIDPDDRHPLTGSLSAEQKNRISKLLGQWEEPTIANSQSENRASVTELLQFRRALEYLHTSYPFSGSFGPADRRETTIVSAQEVYERLLLRSPDPITLQFDVIALLGARKGKTLDQEKVKALIKLFRPDRDGSIDCINFVKAIDSVYKELRLLRASVANSSKIDRAFESIFNVIFYAIVICIVLSQIGYDPLALFLSISGVILGFAFMIGSASSKYFEGLLFILVRRPFQIGDGISISNVNEYALPSGNPFWIVEDVDLFTTKVMYFFSCERATLNNGSLASSRVINSTLSTFPKVDITLKFPLSVSYEKLVLFRKALDEYFRNRPREWAALLKFALTKMETDQGFAQYIVVGRHRLAWVNFGEIMQSKADLMHFCMELSKKLDIWYKNPPLPVDLSIVGGNMNEAMGRFASSSETQPLMANNSRVEFPNEGPDLTDLHNRFRPVGV